MDGPVYLSYWNLKLGQDYLYWSKSVYEKKPSLKRCKLISINKDKCRVLRYDLDVNAIQIVDTKRLKEIKEKKEKQLDLF